MNRISRMRRIDMIPVAAILLIALVCSIFDLFVLKRPVYLLSAVPLVVLGVAAGYRVLRQGNPSGRGA